MLVINVNACLCSIVCVPAQSCMTVCYPRDCNPPGSFVHGIFQARVLKWVATPRYLPDPVVETASLESPALARGFYIMVLPGKPTCYTQKMLYICNLPFI